MSFGLTLILILKMLIHGTVIGNDNLGLEKVQAQFIWCSCHCMFACILCVYMLNCKIHPCKIVSSIYHIISILDVVQDLTKSFWIMSSIIKKQITESYKHRSETITTFVVITVPADGLALLDIRASLGTVMNMSSKFSWYCQLLGAVSIRKTVLPGVAIPMLKIRRPNGRLIFNMEIAIRR